MTPEEWIRAHVEVTGEVERVRARPWSVVLRAPTASGDVYLKQNGPGFEHEVPLLEVLAPLAPDLLPRLVATDAERRWVLMEDAGVEGSPRWRELVVAYAQLQRATVAHVDALVAAGVPDRRLAVLPEVYTRATGRSPRVVEELCAELETLGLPEAIEHDDLHLTNILLRDAEQRIVDWGDACVSHPFLSFGVTRRFLDDDDVDAYLEQWGQPDRLRSAIPAAMRLAGIPRAVTALGFGAREFATYWLDRVDVSPDEWDERY